MRVASYAGASRGAGYNARVEDSELGIVPYGRPTGGHTKVGPGDAGGIRDGEFLISNIEFQIQPKRG